MGTSVSQYDSSTPYDSTLIKSSSLYSGLCCFSNCKGEVFLGREMDIPNQDCKAVLLQDLHKKSLKSHHCILEIERYFFKMDSNVCSQIEKCLILCRKPDYSLSQLFEEKKKHKKGFILSQIQKVIDRVSLALKTLQFNKHTFNSLDMDAIVYCKDDVFLIDPLILEGGEKESHYIKGKYPSPQLLQSQFIGVDSLDVLSIHLFSLGIIALSMIFTRNSVVDLYDRYSKDGRPKKINQELLCKAVSRISDQNLKIKVHILTQMNPIIRKDIFKFKASKPESQNKANYPIRVFENNQPMTALSIFDMKDINSDEASRQQNGTSQPEPTKDISARAMSSKVDNRNIHLRPQPKISTPPPPPTEKPHQPSKAVVSDKQNLNPNMKQHPLTPKKPKIKHEFSTIKEVTEYEDMSENKKSELKLGQFEGKFQGNLIKGNREGLGRCLFSEGSLYEGEWKKDQMNGFGKLFYPNGKLAYEGDWLNNQFNGKGKVYCLSPAKLNSPFKYRDLNTLDEEWVSYEGELLHDKKHGWGILTLSNGERYEGRFQNDFVEGEGTFFRLGGTLISGIWKKGMLEKIVQ